MPVMVSVIRVKLNKRFGLRIESGYRAGNVISANLDCKGGDFPVSWSNAAEAVRWAQDVGYTVITESFPTPNQIFSDHSVTTH